MHDAVCAPRPIQDHLPILFGGSGPTKTLRTTARDADLWNGFGAPERVAQVIDVLRDRCAEIGRPFEEIERTVTIHAVVRDSERAATDAWNDIARHHGIVGRVAADGTERGLTIGGSPMQVARYLTGYRDAGIGEVIVVLRAPFDDETIERVGEVREALAALG